MSSAASADGPVTIESWRRAATSRLASSLTPGREALGIADDPRLDVDALLSHVLICSRASLYARPERAISIDTQARLDILLERRLRGEPLAYLLQRQEFRSLDFHVDERVLVPRDDTETLVDAAVQELEHRKACTIVDAGTGAGIIATAIAAETGCAVLATDIDASMLALARENAERLAPGLITVVCADWLSAIGEARVDLLVSNPPYIGTEEAELALLSHEPQGALISGRDGLTAIRLLIGQAGRVLRPEGVLMLEHGHQQGSAVRQMLRDQGYRQIDTRHDLAGRERVSLGSRPA